ncbi:MAG: glucose 1-dehydrogenase [Planctomycetia bacterium]|nr:glucose 1-dehydrogenase [Planctomycetia bacterium]
MNIDGRAAIVTGGGTGVGRATALSLARQGCAVLVNYSRSKDEAEQTAADVAASGVRALCHKADVADDAACRAMVDAATKEFGRLDVLVNNAATTRFIPHDRLDDVQDADWERILSVNLKGPFQCARAAAKAMRAAGAGAIVNVASVAGIAANGSSIPYCASKAALINMTIALARVLAPSIRVNAVAPGFIDGRWLRAGLGAAYDGAMKMFEQKLPLGRVCQPEDVAAAIMSLITGSDLVTGQTIVCDSGMLIADFARLSRQ